MDTGTRFHHDEHEERPVLTTTEARSGETSGHVRTVLVVSLSLALIVFAVVYSAFFI